jgi:GNAT superfamily N-acetyltransferase
MEAPGIAPPKIVDERDMTRDLDQGIRAGLCASFPKDRGGFSQSRAWHGSHPAFSAVIQQAGRVIAHVGVVDRFVRIGAMPVRVAGVMNVFVLPEYRGHRLADAVLLAAMAEAARRDCDLGLLFCTHGLVPVYARSGWICIDNPVIRIEANQPLPLPEGNVPMVLPLRGEAIPTGAAIDLCGNDW